MPNRILRESILDSEAVNTLTPEGEVFYRRLMSVVDDYGRFDARPAVLRSRLYPLRVERMCEAEVSARLDECATAGLLSLYHVNGKPYLVFHKLGGPPRAKDSKYPPPPAVEEPSCAQPRADDIGCVRLRPYSRSGSDSDTGTNSSPGAEEEAPAAAASGIVLEFPTSGRPKAWQLTQDYLDELRESYAGLDVLGECRKALAWVKANSPKTAAGMPKFIVAWLNRSADRMQQSKKPKPDGSAALAEAIASREATA